MAKSIGQRSSNALRTHRTEVGPGVEVTPLEYWRECKGLNTLAELSQVPNDFAVSIINLMLNQGHIRSRYGIEELGTADNGVLAVLSFTPADGQGILIRLRRDRLETWNGSAWIIVGFIFFTGNLTDRFTWTGWGNELLISNGADRILSFNVLTGFVQLLQESPPARHLTSFNGRVIASAVTEGSFFGYRIRWSVKNDNTDWTAETTTDAIGAGYEDLLTAPGGFVDEVMGVYPLTDDTALVIRENTLWLMLTTGDVDKPFRFGLLTSEIGSRARHANVKTPFGIVVVTHEDVVIVDQSGPKSIGAQIRRTLFSEISDFAALTGAYDPRRQEYRLCNGPKVWRYSFRDQGWTTDLYGFSVRHMSFVDYKSLGITFDQDTPGTMDEPTDTFDSTGFSAAEGMHLVSVGAGEVLRENPNLSTDNAVPGSIEITSGLLQTSGPLDRTGIIEAQLEYKCRESQRVYFEYSTDEGLVWTQYSYVDLIPTAGPKITAVRKTLEDHNLQFRVRSQSLGKLTLISLNLFLVKGARVHP